MRPVIKPVCVDYGLFQERKFGRDWQMVLSWLKEYVPEAMQTRVGVRNFQNFCCYRNYAPEVIIPIKNGDKNGIILINSEHGPAYERRRTYVTYLAKTLSMELFTVESWVLAVEFIEGYIDGADKDSRLDKTLFQKKAKPHEYDVDNFRSRKSYALAKVLRHANSIYKHHLEKDKDK